MIETRLLKNVVIFVQTILSFVLSRKRKSICNDIAQKHRNVTVKDLQKYEKLRYKKNKLKPDIYFLNNTKQYGVYPKFLIFKQPNVWNKDASSIRKRLLRSAINKRNEELQNGLEELSLSENFLSKQLSTIDFYIRNKSKTLDNRKLLQKFLNTLQKKLSSFTRSCSLHSQLTKLLLTSHNMNNPRKNPIYLKQVYTFQTNQIKFENTKSSLPLKRFIVLLLITLNLRNLKVR